MFRFAVSNSSRPSDGSTNPGNSFHIANPNCKMDDNMLEAIFAKVGRVSPGVLCSDMLTRSKEHLSCMTHILMSLENSAFDDGDR